MKRFLEDDLNWHGGMKIRQLKFYLQVIKHIYYN